MNIFGKRLSRAVHRQAITVALIAVGAVMAGTILLHVHHRHRPRPHPVRGRLGVRHRRALDRASRPTCPTPRSSCSSGSCSSAASARSPSVPRSPCASAESSTSTRRRGPQLARFSIFSGDTSRRIAEADSVAVIGLGRFGSSLALELMAGGTEVLGIDLDEELVQSLNGQLTQVVRADSTKEEALRQLAIDEFDRVVVAIGDDISASILTCSVLLGMKIPVIWAKAVDDRHGDDPGAARRAPRDLPREGHGSQGRAPRARRRAGLHRDRARLRRGQVVAALAPARRSRSARPGCARSSASPSPRTRSRAPSGRTPTPTPCSGADDTILIVGPTRKAEGFAQLR